jgi:hypothetical protein
MQKNKLYVFLAAAVGLLIAAAALAVSFGNAWVRIMPTWRCSMCCWRWA